MSRLMQGRIFTQVVGTKGDSTPMIWFFFDNKRYLVNCGEGFQRLCTEHTIRLSKLNGIFLTDLSWGSVGGIGGTLITLSDFGLNLLNISGPRHTSTLLQSLRYFINRPNLNLKIKDFVIEKEQQFEDENLTVNPIIIQPENNLSPRYDKYPNSPIPGSEGPFSYNKSEEIVEGTIIPRVGMDTQKDGVSVEDYPREGIPPTSIDERILPRKLFASSPSSSICCYAFHTPDLRGKFDVKKALEKGIKPGPLFGKLANGETVVNSDGNTVTPEEVLSQDILGSVILVVKCPSNEYIPSLVSSTKWIPYQVQGEHSEKLAVIYHITPENTLASNEYQNWKKQFPSHSRHIAINEACSDEILFRCSSRNQETFSNIDKDIFPSLYRGDGNNEKKINTDFEYANVLDKIQFKPLIPGFPTNSTPIQIYPQSIPSADYPKLPEKHSGWDDTKITFLGTGSAIPGKFRNVSSIHISTEWGKHGILMDAGEGTLGQLYRLHGKDLDKVILSLKFIFITHMHADHHLGVSSIIQYREKLTSDPINIIGPFDIECWLREYCEIHPMNYRYTHIRRKLEINDLLSSINISFTPVEVIHCINAYGFIFQHQSGWKIAHSGDTRPCNNLIREGHRANLLIHEATLEDGMEKEAKKKAHCTIGEAIEVGRKMEAEYTMLSHFSQRYPKIPKLSSLGDKFGIAFDFMTLKFSWLPRLKYILPSIQTVIAQDEEIEVENIVESSDEPVTKKQRIK